MTPVAVIHRDDPDKRRSEKKRRMFWSQTSVFCFDELPAGNQNCGSY